MTIQFNASLKNLSKRNPKHFIVSMTTKFWNFPEDTPTLFLHFEFLSVYRIFEEDLIWKRKCRTPKEEVIFRHLRSGGGVGIAEQKLGFTSTTTHRKFHKGIDKWPISATLYFLTWFWLDQKVQKNDRSFFEDKRRCKKSPQVRCSLQFYLLHCLPENWYRIY